ncbi:hypothetical protein NOCA2200024 [metagenome]|uniref:Uncharacterized protein n=1 Tax=metagenome TaxID=256318 RepID=A0A2P2BY16_9ZZZZ
MATAHPGVVDPEVGLGAAADHQAGRVERVVGAVDLEQGTGPSHLGVGGVVGDLGDGLAAHPEPAGGEVVGGLEDDVDRAREHIALVVGVVAQGVGELFGHRAVVGAEPLEVALAELHVEAVGHQAPVAAQDLRVVVDLALERGRDLDGLDRAAEGACEDAGDHLLELVLESLQAAHDASLRSRWSSLSRPRPSPSRGPPGSVDRIGVAQFGFRCRAGITFAGFTREWRNRQTRTVQVRVSERTWGFNSPLAHNSPRSSDLGLRPFRGNLLTYGVARE